MLKFFILLFLVIALVIGVTTLIQKDAGYMLLSYDGTSIESSLWAGVFALALLLFVLYWLIRLFLKLRYSGRDLRLWRQGRQARRNETQVTQGLIQYMEGDWKSSAKTFSRGASKSPTPLLSYLMAARASAAAGEYDKSDEFLQQAEASTPEAHVAIGLTQAELQLQKGDYENCLANLNRIKQEQPENSLALSMSAKVYAALGDWSSLQELLPGLRKKKLLPEDQLAELEYQTFDNKLRTASSADQLALEWDNVPKGSKKDQRLIGSYAAGLMANGQSDKAEPLLRSALKKDSSAEELLGLYGKLEAGDAKKQLSAIEGWLKGKPDDAALLLAAGRVSMRGEQWDKAKDYLTSSVNIRPNADSCGELGRVMSQLGDTERSGELYQRALGLSGSTEVDAKEPADGKALPAPAADEAAEKASLPEPTAAEDSDQKKA